MGGSEGGGEEGRREEEGRGTKAHGYTRVSALNQSSSAHLHPAGEVLVIDDETNTSWA